MQPSDSDGSTKFLGFMWEQCPETVPVISTGQFFQPCCIFWCSLPFPSLFHSFIPLEMFRAQLEVWAGKHLSWLVPSCFCQGTIILP